MTPLTPPGLELTGRKLQFTHNEATLLLDTELRPRLILARHHWRRDIGWWRYCLGEDDPRFAAPSFDDSAWSRTENLLLRRPNSGEAGLVPHVYHGAAWFRQTVSLPAAAREHPLVLCFGGCNREDWRRIDIHVNGVHLGGQDNAMPCHEPWRLVLAPGDPRRAVLHFGGENLIAIRGSELDRRLPQLDADTMRLYLFEHYLCEQWLGTGEPTETVDDWAPAAWERAGDGWGRELACSRWRLRQRLQPDERVPFWRLRQEAECHVPGGATVLDVRLLAATTVEKPQEGEPGHPLAVGDRAFVAVEHPSGVPRSWPDERRVELWHYPGASVAAGGVLALPDVLFSVDGARPAERQFHRYLEAHGPRDSRPIAVYDPYGCNDYGFGTTLRQREFGAQDAERALQQVDRAARLGLKFDYFVLDVGWTEPTGDFRAEKTAQFPDGLRALAAQVRSRGMEFGLWFPTSFADWGIGANESLQDCRQPGPAGEWPPVLTNAAGQQVWDFGRNFCLATRYADILEEGILHHVRETGVRLLKFDTGNFYCNATGHGHLPGKYSVTAMHDRLIRLARRVKQEDREVFIVWYWGVRSPFFLLHGDTLFESRLGMEGSNFSDLPCWEPRDSAMRNIDLACLATPWIPPRMKDTMGLWLGQTTWGNYLPARQIENAAAIEVARGHLVFPQIWGNLALLSDAQIRMLAARQQWLRAHAGELAGPRQPVGHPLRDDHYGYAFGEKESRLELVTPLPARLVPEVTWWEESCALDAPRSWPVAPAAPASGRVLLLVRAFDADGEPVRIEHAGEWPVFTWSESGIGLAWESSWPDRLYVWKGSGWRAWLSAPATFAHIETELRAAPPSHRVPGRRWIVAVGGVPVDSPPVA